MKGGDKLTEFLAPVIPVTSWRGCFSSTELSLMALSTGLVVVAIIVAWFRFRKYEFKPSKGLGKVLENKWYVDEFYDTIIVKPLNKLVKY